MRISTIALTANTTLTHGTGADQFNSVRGSNPTLTANVPYDWIHNGVCWVEYRTTS
jgi:hypothetical protein